ncbi:MAG: hypothetical protein IJS47_01390 [Clostridia bacterium]|nr:hypothetical protein [Clostridia bacterium]
MKFNKNSGNTMIATPIVLIVVFFIFISFAVMFIRLMEPFVIYEKMSSSSLKYIVTMEEYGYLTDKERSKLKSELVGKGLKEENITIRATSELQEYGDPISLIINYKHSMKLPSFEDSIIPKIKEQEIKLKVFKHSFSKR